MNLRHWNLFMLICTLAATSCGRDIGPEPPAVEAARPLEKIKNTHPRLLLTGRKLETLRAGIETTHKWLWDRYLEDLPAKLERAAQPLPEELNRGHGDLAPDLCFAWLMTGDDSHFQAARDHLLKLARTKPWDPDNDLIHGHLLFGMAAAYDWLYPYLSEEERALP